MKNILCYLTLSVLILSGCATKQQPVEQDLPDSLEKESSALMAYPLPTSMEMSDKLKNADAIYVAALTNDAANISKYIRTQDKAINLGVYTADICYAITFDMKQEVIKFMNATKLLLDDLGILSPYNEQILQSFRDESKNKDSVLITINDSFKDTYTYLRKNKQEHINVLVISGSYIEGLYILTQIAATSKNNGELIQMVGSQKSILKEIMKLMEPFKEHESVKDLYAKMLPLSEAYQKVGFSIEEDQLKEITKIIADIRKTIL